MSEARAAQGSLSSSKILTHPEKTWAAQDPGISDRPLDDFVEREQPTKRQLPKICPESWEWPWNFALITEKLIRCLEDVWTSEVGTAFFNLGVNLIHH